MTESGLSYMSTRLLLIDKQELFYCSVNDRTPSERKLTDSLSSGSMSPRARMMRQDISGRQSVHSKDPGGSYELAKPEDPAM